MDIVAIIAEYNPLHNGHLYHVQRTKEQFPSSRIVVIMSGGFVMRGEPSVISKHKRAEQAIKAGADAVIELPAFTAFLSSEGFAKSGVNVAKLIGANTLSFGSECGDIDQLKTLNAILNNPSQEFKTTFDKKMKEGKSYPRAIAESMEEVYPDAPYNLLNSPNNSLALMYLKALEGTDITPYTVKRTDNGYSSCTGKGALMSATGIRELLKDRAFEEVAQYVPDYVYDTLKEDYREVDEAFSSLVLYKFVSMKKEDIKALYDVGEGLENRLKKYAPVCHNLQQFLDKVKCKRYTLSRLKRICAYALFDVTKDKVQTALKTNYARLLACRRDDNLISYLKSKSIVTCYSDLKDEQIALWEAENVISDTRDLLYGNKQNVRNTLFL